MPVLIRFLLALIVISSPYKAAAQVKRQSALLRKYSPAALKEDVNVMENVILSMHPVIGIYKSKDFYRAYFDSVRNSFTDSLTERDFRMRLKLAIDQLHCGHTEVLYSSAYYFESSRHKYNYSPYFFVPIQGKVYLLSSLDKKKDTLMKRASRIISINGISADSMLRYSRRFITTDGYNTTGKDHYIKYGFNTFYLSIFGRPDTFTVEYLKKDTLKTVKYPAFKARSVPTIPMTSKDDSLYTVFKRARMKFRYLEDDKKTMVLKISSFSRKKFTKGYRKVFRKLKKNRSENLVIDLRNNGGGSLENSYKLLSYLLDSSQTQTLRTGIRSYPYKQYTRGNVFFKLMRFGFKIIAKKKTVNDTDNFIYTIKPNKKYHYDKKVFVLINGG
ncbi:MAG: S41 family peptidase, partial [Bacteroidia bacterium]